MTPRLWIGGRLVRVWDLRDALPQHPFNRYNTRPDDAIRWLVIHHSVGPATQSAESIARYHVETRGWPGIGYAFLARRTGKLEYVGDVDTSRANVANLNDAVVGICCPGDYRVLRPTKPLIERVARLCAGLMAMWGRQIEIVGHEYLNATECPGPHLLAVLPTIRARAAALLEGDR